MPTTPGPGRISALHEALLSDDVVPVHAHDERDDHFVALSGNGVEPVDARTAVRRAAVGHGIADPSQVTDVHPEGPRHLNRRTALRGAAAVLGSMLAPASLPRYAFGAPTPDRDTVLVIFLRGGMDGASALVPVTDTAYQDARGEIAVRPELTHPLTAEFGLHPSMSSLVPLWDRSELAFATGVGAPWASRSHFADQAAAERCAPAQVRSGWLGRHLASASSDTGTLRAITIGSRSTMALSTTFPTLATWTIDGFDIPAAADRRASTLRALDAMYGSASGAITAEAEATFDAIAALDAVRRVPYLPDPDAQYPEGAFGAGLREVSRLINADVGLEVACIDVGDWDMHAGFGSASDPASKFSMAVAELSAGIAAFRTDLGERWARTTVVTISEFGRRVALNGTGLDHGSAGLMMFAGGGINGGQVFGSQPELSPDNLSGGDIPITLDFRQPLSELVTQRLVNPALDAVFPGFTPGPPLGLA